MQRVIKVFIKRRIIATDAFDFFADNRPIDFRMQDAPFVLRLTVPRPDGLRAAEQQGFLVVGVLFDV